MSRDSLEKRLSEARQLEPVPDFEATWRGARARMARTKRARPLWRPALVGAMALFVLGLAFILSTRDTRQTVPVETATVGRPAPSGLGAAAIPELPGDYDRDGLGSEWDLSWPDTDREEAADAGASVAALVGHRPGNDLYESGTDFLLDLDIPTWNGRDATPL